MVSLIEKLYKAGADFKQSSGGIYYAEINGIPIAKVCSSCDEFKVLEEFSFRKDGVLSRMNQCKECVRKYKIENKEIIREKNKIYFHINPEKRLINNRKRWELIRHLPYNLTKEKLEKTLEFFGNCCALTLSEDYELDHVIPIAIGHGGTIYGNIIPLRKDLNISKGNKNIFDWYKTNGKRFGIKQEQFDMLIEYVANANGLNMREYKEFYYWCFDNQRNVEEIKTDKRFSVDIWQETIINA